MARRRRSKYTARGTLRLSKAQRSAASKKAWQRRWRTGAATKAPKKKLLTKKERSARAKDAWVTRRKNLAKLARKQALKLKERREARKTSVDHQIGVSP